MSAKQRWLLILAAAAIIISTLYPPVAFVADSGALRGIGFRPIWDLKPDAYAVYPTVDWRILGCIWGGILISTGLLYSVMRNLKDKAQ